MVARTGWSPVSRTMEVPHGTSGGRTSVRARAELQPMAETSNDRLTRGSASHPTASHTKSASRSASRPVQTQSSSAVPRMAVTTGANPVTLIRDSGGRDSSYAFNDKESLTADPTNANYAYAVWDRFVTPERSTGTREGRKSAYPHWDRWKIRSRLRVGRCEFSARLFNHLWCRSRFGSASRRRIC